MMRFCPRFAKRLSRDAEPSGTHVFKSSGVYDLPFGRGKHFLNTDKWYGRMAVEGWQIGGIFIAQSGTPTSVFASDLSDTGGLHSQYANQTCSNPNRKSGRSFSSWFNTSCFVQPGIGVLGNAGRNDIVGPRYVNLDFSAAKSFPANEGGGDPFWRKYSGCIEPSTGNATRIHSGYRRRELRTGNNGEWVEINLADTQGSVLNPVQQASC